MTAIFPVRVVFNCASTPEPHKIEDPARLGWKLIVKIEHYHVGAKEILNAATNQERSYNHQGVRWWW